MHAARSIITGLVALLSCLATVALASHAIAAPGCKGRDIVAEMAQSDPAGHRALLESAARVSNADAVLWRISKPGAADSYLFGTIHVTDERVTALSPAVQSALAGSRRVALELADMSMEAILSALGRSAALIIDPAGNGLERALTGEEMQRLRAALANAGLPDVFVGLVQPWVVKLLLSTSECERDRLSQGIPVLDMRIAELARQAGVDVIGLETPDSQIEALASLPEPQQIELVKLGLRLAPQLDDMMETMVVMYTRRTLALAWPLSTAMAEKVGIPPAAMASFEHAMLTRRNHRMRDRIVPLLEQGHVLVAVGALHLQGQDGLVRLIRDAGYQVTAVE